MTERERWIVYPLLFLALGAALRDKLVDRTTAKSIVCQELLIVDEESASPQTQRTLARIGRSKPVPGGKSSASLQLNGDLEVVDDDLTDHSAARVLVKVGRTDPAATALSSGYAVVRGEVAVEGIVDAKQYVLQHMPIVPLATGSTGQGVAILGVLLAGQQPSPKVPKTGTPKTQPQSQPPASGSTKGSNIAPPSSPAGKPAPSAE